MPIQVSHQVSLEEVQRVLSDSLDAAFKIKQTSDTTLRVQRNAVVWAVVRVSSSEDRTTFHVRPGGMLLVAMYNALYTVPLVRRALRSLE